MVAFPGHRPSKLDDRIKRVEQGAIPVIPQNAPAV
jgi:hypothetical protein